MSEENPDTTAVPVTNPVKTNVGIAVELGSLYAMWCSRQEKNEKPEENKIVEEPEPVVITPKGPDLFD
jgi:hypothetical protein